MARIEPPSRMMLTPTRIDDSLVPGRLRFQLWMPPDIDMTFYTRHTVTDAEQGRLDLVAYKTLGDPRLWWAVAYVNQIQNPLAAIPVGTLLKIPRMEAVASALLKQNTEAHGG